MNIPEGFVLVPVELTSSMIESGKDERMECLARPSLSVQAALARIYGRIIDSAPDVELPAYDEAAELAACRAHWEKNPNCLFLICGLAGRPAHNRVMGVLVMSEVKRFTLTYEFMDEDPKGEYVYAKDYDAALAREAAERLRADVAVADCNDAEAAGLKVGELLANRTEERGSSHGFEQSPNTCRHDERSGVWWREGKITRTGRECRACGSVEEDPVAAQPQGEVERLRELVKAYMNAEAEKGIELVKLRAQLDEQNALLRLVRDGNGYLEQQDWERIDSILGAVGERRIKLGDASYERLLLDVARELRKPSSVGWEDALASRIEIMLSTSAEPKPAGEPIEHLIACDRHYRNGLMTGFNFGITGNETGYANCVARYNAGIKEARAELAEKKLAKPYPNRICHVEYTAHPYLCGCLKGDEEAQRLYDERYGKASAEPKPRGDAVAWRYHDETGISSWFDGSPDQISLDFVGARGGRIELAFRKAGENQAPSHSGDANEMVAKVVLPELENENCFENEQSEQAIWFNRAIACVAELNGLKPDSSTVVRRAFICKGCEGVYADEAVSHCDCMCEPEFIEGEIRY